jgi:predicted aspartyl protease
VTLDPFIIDTGADASVLPWIDCQRLRLSLSDGVPAVMGGINSSTVTTVYFWIWVVLDGQEYKCRAHVDFMGDERILGRDVLNFMDILLRGPCREAIINP